MFQWFGKARARRNRARALYGAVVARARRPELYHEFGVPDTLDGRFDALALFAALMVAALDREGAEGRAVASALLECMVEDFDRTVRELGVGDVAVGKHVKRMMEAVNGRTHAYAEAAAKGREALAEALLRNLYRGSGNAGKAAALAEVTLAEAAALDAAAGALLTTTDASWPTAEGVK